MFFGGGEEERSEREARGDAVSAPWAHEVPTRMWRISRRLPKLVDRRIPRDWKHSLLVTEMQATNMNAWRHLIMRRPYITFGHGRSGTTSEGNLSNWLKACLNRRASHVLTYAEEGRNAVIDSGQVSPARVTAFGNATDTTALRDTIESIGVSEVHTFNALHAIGADAKVALFLGALHESKRVDLLCEAAREVMRRDPDWWLVVAGDGPEHHKVQELARVTGRVVLLGHATVETYGPAAKQARLIVNPGRIGLVAVDALTFGLPVLTAPGSQRAPEAQHLHDGTTLRTSSEATPRSFAEAWIDSEPVGRASPALPQNVPSIERAAERIASAIVRTSKEAP